MTFAEALRKAHEEEKRFRPCTWIGSARAYTVADNGLFIISHREGESPVSRIARVTLSKAPWEVVDPAVVEAEAHELQSIA